MRNRVKLSVSLFASVFFLISSITIASAQTDIPDMCDDSFILQSAYTVGVLTGGSIVNSAWNAIDQNCDDVVWETTFQDTVLNALTTALQTTSMLPVSSYVECRVRGYIEGINARLDEIEQICIDVCVKDGEFIGEMAAIMYCELSIIFDGMAMTDPFVEGELTVCEEAVTEACKSKFVEISPPYAGEACKPYTEGDFFDVWQLTKNNQCIMNPDTDTDTDTDTDSELLDGGVEDGGQ